MKRQERALEFRAEAQRKWNEGREEHGPEWVGATQPDGQPDGLAECSPEMLDGHNYLELANAVGQLTDEKFAYCSANLLEVWLVCTGGVDQNEALTGIGPGDSMVVIPFDIEVKKDAAASLAQALEASKVVRSFLETRSVQAVVPEMIYAELIKVLHNSCQGIKICKEMLESGIDLSDLGS